MAGTASRPQSTERPERHDVAADAFLLAAAVFLLGTAIQGGMVTAFGGLSTSPAWTDGIGMLAILAAAFGAPLLAWRLHGHHTHLRDGVAGLVGVVAGLVLTLACFSGLFFLFSKVPPLFERDKYGPIDVGAVVAILTVVFLWKPVGRAIAALRSGRRFGVPVLRLALLIALVAVVVGSLVIGGEGAEVGLWLAPTGFGAAAATVGADVAQRTLLRPRPAA